MATDEPKPGEGHVWSEVFERTPAEIRDKLEYPSWAGPPDEFRFDGCTASPDIVFDVNHRIACAIHDWEYRTPKLMRDGELDPEAEQRAKAAGAGTESARVDADWRLYRNLQTCGEPRYIAGAYLRRVLYYSIWFYPYDEGQRPGRAARIGKWFSRWFRGWR